MMEWAVPWTTSACINFAFLLGATLVVTAVPLFYGFRANLRDPLARAVLSGTSATALAFLATSASVVAFHAGWNPPQQVWDWFTRGIYVAVALGKLLLLLALMRVLRDRKHPAVSRNTERSDA